jgi:shikimate dehydrogenase
VNNIKKAGVVGFPIAHSLSPRLHNYWLKKYNIAGEYKAYEVKPENLAEFIENLRNDKDFVGVNLTIPHKEAVMELLDEVDDLAKAIGAVNTIIVENGRLIGKNTDAYGFSENIKPFISGKKKAVVLGAGGAANAIWNIIIGMGFEEVIITNRTKANIEAKESLIKDIVAKVNSVFYTIHEWDNRSDVLQDADLLVNTTSLGMTGKEALEIDLSKLPKTALVTDIVYSPLITPLLAQARARGNPTIDGLGMLLHQAVPAFEAWFGTKPEVTEELRQYILSGK